MSNSKLEQKRQSTKKVNAFLKDIAKSSVNGAKTPAHHPHHLPTIAAATPVTVKKNPAAAAKLIEPPTTQMPSVKAIKEELFAQVKAEPLEPNVLTGSTVKRAITNSHLATNQTCQQNYRVVSHTTSKNTPVVRNRNSFNARNTPNKTTKYVILTKSTLFFLLL